MTKTLKEIERLIGYSAADAASEYLDGSYGPAAEWDAAGIDLAEREGDAGDQLGELLSGVEYDDAMRVWSTAVAGAFEAARAC